MTTLIINRTIIREDARSSKDHRIQSKVQVAGWRNFQMEPATPLPIDWYCFRFARVMGTPSCVKPCTCRSLDRLACQSPPACIKCSRLTWQWPPVPLAVDLVNFSPPPHCREPMCASFVAKRCDWSPLDGDKGARWRNSATSANHMPSLFGRLFRIFFVSLIDSADVYICVRMPIQVRCLLWACVVCTT